MYDPIEFPVEHYLLENVRAVMNSGVGILCNVCTGVPGSMSLYASPLFPELSPSSYA
jgi:hypothetical protein